MCYMIFLLLFRDASTSLLISRLGSLGVYQKTVYFYCCVVNVSFVKFTDFNFMMNNGQMDRGNENPIQHLLWWLRKTTKNSQSDWPDPGFESGTFRIRVQCVTTAPPRLVLMILYIYIYIKYIIIWWINSHIDIWLTPCRI